MPRIEKLTVIVCDTTVELETVNVASLPSTACPGGTEMLIVGVTDGVGVGVVVGVGVGVRVGLASEWLLATV